MRCVCDGVVCSGVWVVVTLKCSSSLALLCSNCLSSMSLSSVCSPAVMVDFVQAPPIPIEGTNQQTVNERSEGKERRRGTGWGEGGWRETITMYTPSAESAVSLGVVTPV
jgi:hypothetical protein